MKKKIRQSTLSSIFGGCSILLLAIMILFSLSNQRYTLMTQENAEHKYQMTALAKQLKDGSSYLTSEVRAYSANGNEVNYDNYWNEVNVTKRRDTALEGMRRIGLSAEEEKTIQSALDLSNSLIPLEEQAMEAVKAGDNQKALSLMYGEEYNTGIARIGEITDTFIAMVESRTSGDVQKAVGLQSLTFVGMLISILVVGAFQGINIGTTRRAVIRPLSLLSEDMLRVAEGELSSPLPLEPDTSEIGMLTDAILRTKRTLSGYVGEISELLGQIAEGNLALGIEREYVGDFRRIKTALDTIISQLNGTFAHIGEASGQVTGSSRQVSESAQALAQGAAQQASAVERLNTAIVALSEQVGGTAENANHVDAVVSAVSDELEGCNGKMQQTIGAMGEIKESAGEIGKIIKTIEDIAFQTNILALNAAVEAARAGAAGKGFAVVADEVRNLANKSAEAAKETTALIDSAIHSVEKGTGLADETARMLVGIVDGARRVTQSVAEITLAANSQAQGIQEVSQSMEQIATVVQNNSASSQESAAASEALLDQAQTLRRLVAQFRLLEERRGANVPTV